MTSIVISPIHFMAFTSILSTLRETFVGDEVFNLGEALNEVVSGMDDSFCTVSETDLTSSNVSGIAIVSVTSKLADAKDLTYRAVLQLKKTEDTYRLDTFTLKRNTTVCNDRLIYDFKTCTYEVVER